MANMDSVFSWLLSDEKDVDRKNPVSVGERIVNTDRDAELFYFVDVCAGPGGFSEYMLWRKGFYNAKGFGFTLRDIIVGKDDFKLNKFTAANAEFFEPYYGVADDGDITNPENLQSLENFVKTNTNGVGVHLVMADGGFSVEGRENLQEVLSKRLYLCQFIAGLSLLRIGNRGCGCCYIFYQNGNLF